MAPHPLLKHVLPSRFHARFIGVSWRDLAVSMGPIVLVAGLAVWATVYFIHPAPPDTLTITSGPEGSAFRLNADKYAKILARNGVTLKILPSQGSLENLQRLNDPKFKVDIGLVQGGIATPADAEKLMSLGSLFNVPLMVFYRGHAQAEKLSDFAGKRIAVGPEGSGTHTLALSLLKANGIAPGGATQLPELTGEQAAQALHDGKIDAAMLMGDSATPPVMRKLLLNPQIRLFNFRQADAYARRYTYLNKFELPMGSFDVGKNLPAEDLALIGPTVELIAREDLAPAVSDLLIEAAREVHGRAGMLQHAGQFPAPLEHEFRISDDATRYYQSGKGFLYRYLPFWLASIANRVLVVVVPLVVLLIPALRMVPWVYSWRIRSRIYRWYGALIAIERAMLAETTAEDREKMATRLDQIDNAVNQLKVPLAFADQFYVLRGHIDFVRGRLIGTVGTGQPGGAAAGVVQAPAATS